MPRASWPARLTSWRAAYQRNARIDSETVSGAYSGSRSVVIHVTNSLSFASVI